MVKRGLCIETCMAQRTLYIYIYIYIVYRRRYYPRPKHIYRNDMRGVANTFASFYHEEAKNSRAYGTPTVVVSETKTTTWIFHIYIYIYPTFSLFISGMDKTPSPSVSNRYKIAWTASFAHGGNNGEYFVAVGSG